MALPTIDGFDFATTIEHLTPWQISWRRLRRSKAAWVGMAIVVLFALTTTLAHFFWVYNPKTDGDLSISLSSPTLQRTGDPPMVHPFGTDKNGRDVFRRVIHGGWNSLRVGVVSVAISLSIGGLLGLLAGFYESMEIDDVARAVLFSLVGVALGAIPAWIAGQYFQIPLFLILALLASFTSEWRPGRPERAALFALAGLLVGGIPALLVSPYTAAGCGLLGLLLGAILGLPLGGPVLSNLIMRFMDIILAFPGILLAIAIASMLGTGLEKGMVAIGVVNIPVYARLVRSSVLAVIQNEYISAEQALGAGTGRTLFLHIVPNSLSPVIVQTTLGLGSAILSAAALGFLGLGAIAPEPEWGAMLSDSYRYLSSGSWWVVLFPGLAIVLSVLGFNLLGDGLRDALDPRLRM